LNEALVLLCPRCKAAVAVTEGGVLCTNPKCPYADQGFPLVDRQPVLIDFADSIFQRSNYMQGSGSTIARDPSRRSWKSRLNRLVDGRNPVAGGNCQAFLSLLKADCSRPRVLVIGGGVLGHGAGRLYNEPSIDLLSTDVYASAYTSLLCDAHKLPFEDGTFDGVWVQAVLEHVLDPQVVVAEIHRVLRPSGLVYAETPFMQQLHERAYDFTRFTKSGHRWLFKRFEEISAGAVTGPGTAFLWSMRYLLRALGAGDRFSRLMTLPFFWIRFLDHICRRREAADAAGGLFFLGRRSDHAVLAASMVSYYENG
jgi:SAM-dependent methyltransferase